MLKFNTWSSRPLNTAEIPAVGAVDTIRAFLSKLLPVTAAHSYYLMHSWEGNQKMLVFWRATYPNVSFFITLFCNHSFMETKYAHWRPVVCLATCEGIRNWKKKCGCVYGLHFIIRQNIQYDSKMSKTIEIFDKFYDRIQLKYETKL